MRTRPTNGHCKRAGQSLVEFALVALVLYMLLAAILTFGHMLYVAQGLQGAADLAARRYHGHHCLRPRLSKQYLPMVRLTRFIERVPCVDLDTLVQVSRSLRTLFKLGSTEPATCPTDDRGSA